MKNFRTVRVLFPMLAILFCAYSCTSSKSSGTGASVAVSQDSVRLFVIGNSFSANSLYYLPQIVKNAGKKLVLGRAEIGGCSLKRHWDYAQAFDKDPNDPQGKQYSGKSLRTLLSNGKWDVITLQQYSRESGDIDTYHPYLQQLVDYVKAIQPDAKIVIHQTWAYRVDEKSFGFIKGEQKASSQAEMYKYSSNAYYQAAREINADVWPVGDAYYQVDTDPVMGFKPDTKFVASAAKAGELPDQTHSLHKGYVYEKGKLIYDGNHASPAGCYLGGLVWFAKLFNTPASTITYRPDEVDAAFATYLRTVADDNVKPGKKNKRKNKIKA